MDLLLYLIQMRNTLPLSSFPLQLMLVFEQFYHLFVALVVLFLTLYKTYNLPYSGPMAVQEGIVYLLFLLGMQGRIRHGIGANRVPPPTLRLRAQREWRSSWC